MRLPVFLCLLLAACATQKKFQANMNGWIGRSEADLISTMGPPQSVYSLDSDTKILTYVRSGQMVLPGQSYSTPVTTNTTGYYNAQPFNAQSTTYVAQQGPATVINMSCTVNLTIHSGSIAAWRANGNNCVSR